MPYRSMSSIIQFYYTTKKETDCKSSIDVQMADCSEDEDCGVDQANVEADVCGNCEEQFGKAYFIDKVQLCYVCWMYLKVKMLRLLFALTVPTTVYTAVQCYVGQKLFSYESNNAICARFIPYHCAAQCEWRRNCSSHSSYIEFQGERTFVSGLLINSKSLMVLCCASLSTRLETDERNRNKCTWRDTESIVILSPSIRTNPVLAPNHYIRDARMERDGKSRVDVTLEVCQYRTEREHCNLERMTEEERQSFESITQKLHRSEEIRTVQKSGDTLKTSSDDKTARDCVTLAKECEEEIKSRMRTCCHDKSRCDNACLKGIEKSLSEERTRKNKGCSVQEIQFGINCLSRKINNLILKR